MAPRAKKTEPRVLANLALVSLVRYTLAGLANPDDHMHEDLAVRAARAVSKNRW